MRRLGFAHLAPLAGLLVVQAGCDRSGPGVPRLLLSDGDLAFVDVHVIPMNEPGVLPNQTVLVQEGRIAEMGPTGQVEVPSGATVVPAAGHYLIPGLAEMHAHVPTDAPSRDEVEELMFLYLANGITTIRGMQGAEEHLSLARDLEAGRILGPTLYVGSPPISGESAPDAGTGERLVQEYAEAGYDLIKTYPGMSRETWNRVLEAARRSDLSVAGHVPVEVGLFHAMATGMSGVDHLDGFLEALLGESYHDDLLLGAPPSAEALEAALAPDRIAGLAGHMARAGLWVVPTLQLWEYFFNGADPDSLVRFEEMRYVSDRQRRRWHAMRVSRGDRPDGIGELVIEGRLRFLTSLSDSGGRVMMGTDSPQMFQVPGFSLHREVELYEQAGLPPWEILAAATRTVAEYAEEALGKTGDFGTVEVGKRADLVLLGGNPLDDLANLRRPAGVVIRGRWLTGDEIQRGLAALSRRYEAP